MADLMPAEIWIGGKLPRSLLNEFPISDLRLDWDETALTSTSEDQIVYLVNELGAQHAGRQLDGLIENRANQTEEGE